MNSNLTVNDPLAGQEVTIIITLAASDQPREDRPVLVSVGLAEQMPVIRTGAFGRVPALINEAWSAFGVRAQTAEITQEAESVSEEEVVATAEIQSDEPAPQPEPQRPTPRPQAANLSLF
jgi:hypothetical protein